MSVALRWWHPSCFACAWAVGEPHAVGVGLEPPALRGFLERRIYWDADSEEGVLLIHWASRRQWQDIAAAEVERVQRRFDQLARQGTGRSDAQPFPLLSSGELIPQ